MTELNNILFIEDDPDIQTIARLALETVGGFSVKTCDSGDKALHAIEKYTPQLFLLDVMMPGMDGPGTLKKLRKTPALANVPAIFMTAKIQTNELSQYIKMGALDVIAKPFDPMTLAEQIRDIWKQHQLQQ